MYNNCLHVRTHSANKKFRNKDQVHGRKAIHFLDELGIQLRKKVHLTTKERDLLPGSKSCNVKGSISLKESYACSARAC